MLTNISDFTLKGTKEQVYRLHEKKGLYEVILSFDKTSIPATLDLEPEKKMLRAKVNFRSQKKYTDINKKITILTKNRNISDIVSSYLNYMDFAVTISSEQGDKSLSLPKNAIEIKRWQKK